MGQTLPNAFVFKVFIQGQYRMCVCPRVNDQWSEKDIFYVENPQKELFDGLDNKFFNVVFVTYEKDDKEGFLIKPGESPYFLKSDTVVAEDLYHQKRFFSTIEDAYNKIYNKSES